MKGLGIDFSTAVLLEVRTDNGSAAAKKSATTQSFSTHFAGRSTKSVVRSTSPDHLPAPLLHNPLNRRSLGRVSLIFNLSSNRYFRFRMHLLGVLLLVYFPTSTSWLSINRKCNRWSLHPLFNSVNNAGSSSNLTPRSKTKVGRPQRKLASEESTSSGRVSVYCVGDSINIKALRAHVFRRGFGGNKEITNGTISSSSSLVLTRSNYLEIEDDEVLHVSNAPLFITIDTNPYQRVHDNSIWDNTLDEASSRTERMAEQNDKNLWDAKESLLMATQDVFYFDYGCVVFWGLTIQEERAAMTELIPFSSGNISSEALEESFDTMNYVYDKKANPQRPIRSDKIRLTSIQLEEKLAFSYAMAQSSKLFVFETKVLNAVEATRYLPRELAVHGRISSSKKDLNKLIGQLFAEQTEVNLFSSILDTPDFLWDDEAHFSTYKYTRSYLEVDDRITLLNRRLQVIRELLDVLTAQVTDTNSTRLEWIIIWLIAIEIVMGMVTNPIFAGRRAFVAAIVPAALILYRQINWWKD